MKFARSISCFLGMIASVLAAAQFTPLFTPSYPNSIYNRDDQSAGLTIDGKGNVFLTGSSKYAIGSVTGTAIWTQKYTNQGVKVFDRFGRSSTNNFSGENDFAKGIAVDSLGNAYVVAEANHTSVKSSMILVKYSPSGALAWTRLYIPALGSHNVPAGIGIDSKDRIYIGGTAGDGSKSQYAIAQYSNSGVLNWHREVNAISATAGKCIAIRVLPDGTSCLAGSVSPVPQIGKVWLVKFSASGAKSAESSLAVSAPGPQQIHAMDIFSDGSVCVTGSEVITDTNYFYAERYSSDLVLQWSHDCYGGTSILDTHFGGGRAVTFGPDGSVFATGDAIAASNHTGLIVKWNATGTQKFATRFGLTSRSPYSRGTALVVDIFNRAYIGYEMSDGLQPYLKCGVLTVNGVSGGANISVNTGDYHHRNQLAGIAVDSLGRVFLAGTRHPDIGYDDFLFQGYAQPCQTINHSYTVKRNEVLVTTAANGVLSGSRYNLGATAMLGPGLAHGSITLNSDGSFTYTPEPGYAGFDTFEYRSFQGQSYGIYSTATILVTY